ncbi:MAG: hypothetical protein HWE20_04235 [Gammaproteobacteria bacterium]|nr:hypothetical protein [Gammaproteobacteria bacterium]
MAKRPIFLPSSTDCLVDEVSLEFEWFPGFAVSQKQKSIADLHRVAIEQGICSKPLEISSKSEIELGNQLSAFNLQVQLPNGRKTSLENIFQASKVFERGGPYRDLLDCSPLEAKRDIRLKESGDVVAFKGRAREWPTEPKTAFYDWIYSNAVKMQPELLEQLLAYDAFTDIEFNPSKSFNCQARSAALLVWLHRTNRMDALEDPNQFLSLYSGIADENSQTPKVQKQLI